jgi:hypothetical protein
LDLNSNKEISEDHEIKMIGLKLISKLKLLGARLTRHNPNGLRIMSVTANVQKEFLSYQVIII